MSEFVRDGGRRLGQVREVRGSAPPQPSAVDVYKEQMRRASPDGMLAVERAGLPDPTNADVSARVFGPQPKPAQATGQALAAEIAAQLHTDHPQTLADTYRTLLQRQNAERDRDRAAQQRQRSAAPTRNPATAMYSAPAGRRR